MRGFVRRSYSRFSFHISQRTRLRIMAFITVADTGLISYVSTRNLAERWGFETLSWLYPLCLDAVAAVGMDLWMSNSPAKRAAKWLALFAVALSLAANVVDWLYVGPGAAVLGAVPPLMLAALLLTLHRHVAYTQEPTPAEQALHDEPGTVADAVTDRMRGAVVDPAPDTVAPVPLADSVERADQPSAVPAPDVAATPAPGSPREAAPVPAGVPRRRRKGPKPRVSDEMVVAALRKHEQNDQPLSRRRVMSMYHMGTSRADRLMAEARNGARHGARRGVGDGVRDEVRNGTQFDVAILGRDAGAGS
jgi:uncharacterized protein DUF2637